MASTQNNAPTAGDQAPDFHIEGKVVLVSGGAGDIGEAVVRAFAEQNSRVILGDLDRGRADGISKRFQDGDVSSCHLDITSEESVKEAVATVKGRYGRIDVLINVAGVLCRKSFFDTSKEDFEESLAVNVTGLFLTSREVAALMAAEGAGSIIHISSLNAKLAAENRVLYGATKAAVNSLTQSMALELGPLGIRVNAVAPGIVDSKMARVRLDTPELRKTFADAIPLRRLALPVDVARCALFLASPYADYISGEVILVDGALTTRMSIPSPR
jgi:NAD(P)-dependent dehydrogenase (short-subunit alcohol dehydrogenase family)